MNIGYVLFFVGVVGVALWTGGVSAGTTANLASASTSCMQTMMGDIAMCE
jgi:hypothetical protein